MKKFIVFCLVSALSFSVAFAKEGKPKKRHKPKVEKKEESHSFSFVDRLMKLDKNEDGLLSREELEAFKPQRPMFGPTPMPPTKKPPFGFRPHFGPKAP